MIRKDENGYWQIDICDADVKSIETIIDYLYDEEKHYYGCIEDNESVDDHIYNHIKVLKQIFERCKEREN